MAEHRRLARWSAEQPEQDLDQGGLARAVRPDQSGDARADDDCQLIKRCH